MAALKMSYILLTVQALFLPPANEVCDGYVFTDVCLFTGWGGRSWSLSVGVTVRGGSPSRGVSVQGALCLEGLYAGRGVCPGETETSCTVTSGRYASYWNVFVFSHNILKTNLKFLRRIDQFI